METNTVYLCEQGNHGVTLLEYRSLDSLAVVPDQIGGRPVTALAPYLFSVHENHNDTQHPGAFWQSGEGLAVSQAEALALPRVKGNSLEELRLPAALKQVGAYAFYNCEKLKRLELYSTTLDWGPGVFTGCTGIKEVRIHVDESRRSCLKEILAELRQTLTVDYDGPERAKLIFPEFFEEAVENTPARILVTNTHGCGHQYRNAFVQTQFQFHEYDSLFPHVRVQEPESLVAELAMGRLRYPCRLAEEHRARYMEYLGEHRIAAACQAVDAGDAEKLEWLTGQARYQAEDLRTVVERAGKKGNTAAVSLLMDKMRGQGSVKRRRFEL